MSNGKKWVRNVTTDSTHPPKSLFKKDAKTIARSLSSEKVSPKGIGSGIRMLQYYINRAGKNLPASRRKVLDRAKHLMQDKLRESKQK